MSGDNVIQERRRLVAQNDVIGLLEHGAQKPDNHLVLSDPLTKTPYELLCGLREGIIVTLAAWEKDRRV